MNLNKSNSEQIYIRPANVGDIEQIINLLKQVCSVHAKIRPDLFIDGNAKYTKKQLEEIIFYPLTPVFVAEKNSTVIGYAFCQAEIYNGKGFMTEHKTLYIDDLCVDENHRKTGVGKKLFDYVCDYAKQNGFYNVTLNVWVGNEQALSFYQSLNMEKLKICMEKKIK